MEPPRDEMLKLYVAVAEAGRIVRAERQSTAAFFSLLVVWIVGVVGVLRMPEKVGTALVVHCVGTAFGAFWLLVVWRRRRAFVAVRERLRRIEARLGLEQGLALPSEWSSSDLALVLVTFSNLVGAAFDLWRIA